MKQGTQSDIPGSVLPKSPRWTVLYNSGNRGYWIGTAWEFYDHEADAQRRYDELSRTEFMCPTKRPYHASDKAHLGAVHTMRGEG